MNTEQDRTISLIQRVQQGDERARETLITNYHGYIINLARQYTRENCDILHTDAYSVALIAFNEAIDKYSPGKKTFFPSFAGQIIKRRLIDLVRSSAKYKPEIITENIPEYAAENTKDLEQQGDLAEDIAWFEQSLADFDISMEDLVRETPKHKDTRCKAIAMARQIAGDPALLARLKQRKKLPFKSLLFQFRCNPKTIQRHRKYIIAVCIAISGSSIYLRDYVLRVAKGCEDYGP